MGQRHRNLRSALISRYPESSLDRLTGAELGRLRERFPKLPDDLAEFFQEVGCGCIGDSRYMIYDLYEPTNIFDAVTAAELDGVFLVGDDFSGRHEAYDVKSGWVFGTVGGAGRFQPYGEFTGITDFVEHWFVSRHGG